MMLYTEEDAQRAAEYVVYLRKSRQDIEAEKRGEMETLARHERILKDVAQEQGLNVTKVYKELVSGDTIQDRVEIQALLKEVYAGKYAGILVVAADRLSRGSLEDMGKIMNALKFSSTLLVTPGKTYDVTHNRYDEQMLEMQLFNSKQEYRAITGRLQEGKNLSIREGNWLASSPPYGYDIHKPDKWTRTLIPNDKAPLVVQIFEWFVNDGMTCGKIAKKLSEMGIPSPSGMSVWSKNTVHCFLRNEAYIGKVCWYKDKETKEMDESGQIVKHRRRKKDYLLVEGKHPGIVPEELFNAAQPLFSGQAPVKAHTSMSNPLSGILVCSKCGRGMRYHTNKAKNTHVRYCHVHSFDCKIKTAKYTDVMALLCQALREYIEDFSFKIDNADKMEEAKKHAAEIDMMETELEKAHRKRRRLFDDYENEVYTAEEFRERKTIWSQRIENIEYDLEKLRQTQPVEIDYHEKVVKFSKVLEALQDDSVSAKDKNTLLKEILERIEYTRDDDGSWAGGKITLALVLKP